MNKGSGAETPDGTTVSLNAKKLVGGGRAIAHHDGATWMVAGALPGELIEVQPTKRRAGIVEARTLVVLERPHPARLPDPCPHAVVCGGCDWPHVDPEAGASLKADAAAEAARAFPNLAALIRAAPIHPSPTGYRLRARLHWDPEVQRLGFFEARSQQVSSIDSCRILSPQLMEALPVLTAALAASCPVRVDLEWIEGSKASDAVAALRPAKRGPPKIEAGWIPSHDEAGAAVRGFHRLGKTGKPTAGWGATDVRIDLPISLSVPIGAFFQANRHLIGPLFERVAELVGNGSRPVYDLHAGVGFLAAAALSAGRRELTLVEPHRGAAGAAGRNLPQARVINGTDESFLSQSDSLPPEATVITDPPRTGLSKSLRPLLTAWNPARIVMLGCDPATWARDAGFLIDHGYTIRVVEVFDLFPSTHHVEILALLEPA